MTDSRGADDPCTDYLIWEGEPAVHRDDILDVWIVTGFQEVTELLRNPALSSAWPTRSSTVLHDGTAESAGTARIDDTVRRWFMFNDFDQHRAMRRLVAPLFSAQHLARIEPYITELVDRLIPDGSDGLDVISELAVPLSSGVICRLLGLPMDTAPQIIGWAHDIAPLLYADYLPDVTRKGREALRGLETAVQRTLARPDPGDGAGLTLLRQARDAGEIDDQDVLSLASLLIYAGFETTSAFIGKAVRSALHAGQWPELGGPDSDRVIEELLRFDTSVRQIARVTTSEVTVGGRTIPEGELVLLMLGAANRDEEVFAQPHHLSYGRPIKRHLAFGQGPHYCLGAPLARLEVRIALRQLVARWGAVQLAGAPVVEHRSGVPVLRRLDIRPVG